MSSYLSLTKPSVFTELSGTEQFSVLSYYQNTYEKNLEDQISDSLFDLLVQIYESKNGISFQMIGASPAERKVLLPYYMGSLDKIKGKTAEKDLIRWLSTFSGEKVIQDKIDGISALYIIRYIKGELTRVLYTRGDGVIGSDISHLLGYLELPVPKFDIVIRGELVIPNDKFKSYILKNPQKNLKNARNASAGLVNAKEVNEDLIKLMDFIAYNITDWSYDKIPIGMQLKYLEKLQFKTPWYVTEQNVTVTILENLLRKRKESAPYDIDGIVVSDNAKFYPIEEGKNPKDAIAFKIDEFYTTVVTDVVWEPSKDGVLKPVVFYEPIQASGVTMTKASGKNAKFIIENKIGIGSEIVITRAGDVIPDIVDILSEASDDKMKLPEDDYVWNSSGIELILKDVENNDNVQKNRIEYFMTTLDIKNVGPGRISLLYDSGFTTIHSILSAKVSDFAKISGLGEKSGQQMYDNIHSIISAVSLPKLMAASGIFGAGFGYKRMEAITSVYPDIETLSKNDFNVIVEKIQGIEGFDQIAIDFAKYLPYFIEWLKLHPMIKTKETTVATIPLSEQPLKNIKVVFTGFRSQELEDKIKQFGGAVTTTVNKTVSFLIAKDVNDIKGKAEKALELKIPIISLQDFKEKYNF